MKKIMKKIISLCMITFLTFSMCEFQLLDATTIAPGDTFSSSFYCGFYEGSVSVSVSNATLTSTPNWCDREKTITAKAVAKVDGSASISFYANDLTNVDEMELVAAGTYLGGTSVTVYTYVAPVDTRSTDSTLSSLTVEGYELTPNFTSSTLTYTLAVEGDVEEVDIVAQTNNGKATVTGDGVQSVSAGENEFNIVVSAENETTTTYTINITVDDTPTTFISYNDNELGVVKDIKDIEIPETFEEVEIMLNEEEIPGWYSESMDMHLVYLIDSNTNEKNFYIYENESIVSIFKPIVIADRRFILLDIASDEQQMSGFTYTTITIEETELTGWVFEDETFSNYTVLYLLNYEGEMNYYLYEVSEGTLQLYLQSAPIQESEYEILVDDLAAAQLNEKVFLICSVLFALGFIISVFLLLQTRRKKTK